MTWTADMPSDLPEEVLGPRYVRFLGLDFEPMETATAAARLDLESGMGGRFSYVVTPNVDHCVRLERDPALRPLYEEAGLLLNDSRILEILAAKDGKALTASPGADIVETLLRDHIDPDEPVVVIGCETDDIEALKRHYGLTRLAWHAPPHGLHKKPEAIASAAAFMAAHPARFHFLCVGSPQQEMVAHAAHLRGDVEGVGLCCGASLDFLTGKTKRAPKWMRASKLEWLHRLASNPRRLAKRYLLDGPRILQIWLKSRDGN